MQVCFDYMRIEGGQVLRVNDLIVIYYADVGIVDRIEPIGALVVGNDVDMVNPRQEGTHAVKGIVKFVVVAETGFVIIVKCVLFGSRAMLAAALLPFGILVIYPCENDINFNRGKVDTIFKFG